MAQESQMNELIVIFKKETDLSVTKRQQLKSKKLKKIN